MSRGTGVFAALLIAFIVFITMRGELVQYLKVFGLARGSN